jgi:phage tail sheath protein FI
VDYNQIADESALSADRKGLWALEKADLFNIMCIPPFELDVEVDIDTWSAALAYCKKRRAFLIVDPPFTWDDPSDVTSSSTGVDSLNLRDENAAIYFPNLKMADALNENRLATFVPCGVVAGIYARTDAQRGVWKAPAGQDATLSGVREMVYKMTDGENGQLNPLGVNCLRTFPVIGNLVWGARTLEGADRLASEWKYIPVRRLALFLEESLYRGTQWVVFEPNDEPLWAQIRLNVGAFMHNLFRQGAFQGTTPREAYFVKCDKDTTTQNDRDQGIVNILVGFAPLKPAEFVIIKISQIAGNIQT